MYSASTSEKGRVALQNLNTGPLGVSSQHVIQQPAFEQVHQHLRCKVTPLAPSGTCDLSCSGSSVHFAYLDTEGLHTKPLQITCQPFSHGGKLSNALVIMVGYISA
jgi:hypothetical protein